MLDKDEVILVMTLSYHLIYILKQSKIEIYRNPYDKLKIEYILHSIILYAVLKTGLFLTRNKFGLFCLSFIFISVGCRSPPLLTFDFISNSETEEIKMFDNTNQYKLRVLIIENEPRYYATFMDCNRNSIEIEINESVALSLFQEFVRTERNLRRSDERNLEYSKLTEQTLHQRALYQPKTLEDEFFRNFEKELLWQAIDTLPEIQRRRLILYYFEGFTFDQIAKIEGCQKNPVKRSIDRATEKIKSFFEI